MDLSYSPDPDYKEVWPKMNHNERLWYRKFWNATVRHDWKALKWLCDLVPGADYARLKQEIEYELKAQQRAQYTITDNKPRYSEHDYGWAPKPSGPNVRAQIQYDYYGGEDGRKVWR